MTSYLPFQSEKEKDQSGATSDEYDSGKFDW